MATGVGIGTATITAASGALSGSTTLTVHSTTSSGSIPRFSYVVNENDDTVSLGDMDVFIVNQEGRPMLLRNDGGNKKNWIELRVKCSKSNRTGFGAKVEIEAGGATQQQEIGGQTSYLSQNFQRVHFGLNMEKEVTRLKVKFPSDVIRVMEHVPANQIVTVVE